MAKIKRKPKKPNQVWKYFKKEGDKAVKTKKDCPKCGAGFTLSVHKDRTYCGKCAYSEFQSKAKV